MLPENAKDAFWQIENVTMEFPGVRALDDVSFNIHRGEILGLLGENGSGKSTMIKCLSGVHHPQTGTFIKDGQPARLSTAADARKDGVATVFQEFSLVQSLSVTENIFLGRLMRNPLGKIDWAAMRKSVQETLDMLEIDISPDAAVSDLSVAGQQMVEIAKGYTTGGSLMILDEPTTALAEPDIKRLHALLRRLASEGQAILYISHRLDEVMEIVNRAVILRNGQLSGVYNRDELSIDTIVQAMSGRVISEHYPKEHNAQQEISLRVDNLKTGKGVNGVSFDVKRGEVFGLAGLLGSGRTEIARALFGVDKVIGGSIELDGKTLTGLTPGKAVRCGIAYVTENRKTLGMFFNFEGPQNTTAARLKKLLGILPKLDLKAERESFQESIENLEITPASMEKLVGFLSGGNQQKIILARWIYAEAELFILDEPTQGIDVGSRLQVYRIINELTRAGKSVILISSDHMELFAMSDRIATVKGGKIHRIMDAKDASKSVVFDE